MKQLKWAGPALVALVTVACGDADDDVIAREADVTAETTPAERAEAAVDEIGQPELEAEQTITVMTQESPQYGRYLTDGNGRPLYMFTADTVTDGATPRLACTGQCLNAWPPALTVDNPVAGAGIDRGLLGATSYGDDQLVTYAGWPLYYYAGDGGGAADPKGNEVISFGGEWYLVTPDGHKVGAERE